jgi:hypothetical protein
LRESLAIFREHPVIAASLGLCLVLSVCALCCGLGIFALPWFGCELYAFQVRVGTGEKVSRKRAWISAGLFILAAASLVVVASAVSSLGVDFEGQDAFTDARRIGLSVSGVTLAMLFIVPFTYAPRILVDKGGSIGGAALESARFFVHDGVPGHLALVVLAHLVQSSPLLVAAIVGLALADASAVPILLLVALPFLAVSVPIGQGVITAAWVARRGRLTDASKRRPAGRLPLALSALLAATWIAPGLSLALVIASLLDPSELPVVYGSAPGELVAEAAVVDGRRSIAIPDTALTIEIEGARATVEASDGGGAGRLPLPDDAPITNVIITRDYDGYYVDLQSGGTVKRVVIDRAGVRQDDDLRKRLSERFPFWGLPVLGLALLITPLLLTRVLVGLADLRRSATLPKGVLSEEDLAASRRRVLRAGTLWTLLLAPLSIGSLIAGLVALLG